MPSAPKQTRRWYQFGLGTIFVVVTAIGMYMACIANWIERRQQFVAEYGAAIAATEAPWPLMPLRCEGADVIPIGNESQQSRAHALFPEATIFVWDGTGEDYSLHLRLAQ